MSNKDLRNEPHNINDQWWWYEETWGISVVHNPAFVKVGGRSVVKISWRAIRAALRRKDGEAS